MKRLDKRMTAKGITMWAGWPYLIVLLVCFFIGAFCGGALAALNDSGDELSSYLYDYFSMAAQKKINVSFFSVLWDCVKWPLLTVVLGFTVLGAIGIPVLFAVRGFLFSFTVCTFGALLGGDGAAAAAVLFSVTALLVLPVLFMVGCEGLRVSCRNLPNSTGTGSNRFQPEILLPGIGVLAIATALQWTVVPTVLSAVCSRIFT